MKDGPLAMFCQAWSVLILAGIFLGVVAPDSLLFKLTAILLTLASGLFVVGVIAILLFAIIDGGRRSPNG